MPRLGYDSWRRFVDAIERAKAASANTGAVVDRHFMLVAPIDGVVTRQSGQFAIGQRLDFNLSRFASYLIAMNGDPRKPEVAGCA